MTHLTDVAAVLGSEARGLLEHTCATVEASRLKAPGSGLFLDRLAVQSDRSPAVLGSLRRLFGAGRLGGTGYLSLLPVDHGIAHTAGMVFAPNPDYLDPRLIVGLALEGGSSALVSSYGVLGAVARAAGHRMPLVLKLNHDEHLSWPARFENILFARVEAAAAMGCAAVAATVYFGGPSARRELRAVSALFAQAHALGLATILFCYLHPRAFRRGGSRMIFAADLTAEANHQGVTIEADLIKQKQPTWTGGFTALGPSYGRVDKRIYSKLASVHPIDLTRYQVLATYAGAGGVIHSGGAKSGNDVRDAVRSAVINKRGGGMGMLAGRKAFQVPRAQGVRLLHAIQDVYLDQSIGLA